METANFTGDMKQTTVLQLVCSPGLTTEIHGHLTFLSVLNIFLSITACLGNILILIALHKESSLHPPSKLLFRCLATTDLFVGLITEPLAVIFWLSEIYERWNICDHVYVAKFITGYILGGVSLLTLTAISVDRLLALLLGLSYRLVITLKRTYVSISSIWVLSTVSATMYFLNYLIVYWSCNIIVLFCLITSIICYTKIFLELRRQRTQVQDHINQEQPIRGPTSLHIARHKKAVSSALCLQLTLVACYLPIGIVAALHGTNRELSTSLFLAGQYVKTLGYLNSSLNPILYCWKIREVRQAVNDTIGQLMSIITGVFLL